MFSFISKRASHPATTGRDNLNLIAKCFQQLGSCILPNGKTICSGRLCLLVTMSVQHDFLFIKSIISVQYIGYAQEAFFMIRALTNKEFIDQPRTRSKRTHFVGARRQQILEFVAQSIKLGWFETHYRESSTRVQP